jgi:hypothetical protein
MNVVRRRKHSFVRHNINDSACAFPFPHRLRIMTKGKDTKGLRSKQENNKKKKKDKRSVDERWRDMAKACKTVDEFMEQVRKTFPRDYYRYGHNIRTMAIRYHNRHNTLVKTNDSK